ncbi:MAG: D-aminoacyl-tRNA deacylase, partial [Candidatus Nanoarchaeia archaeon]
KSNFLVNYEVTHHGPTRLMTPVFFVEIGDGGEQWEDPVANVMVSRAVHMFVDKKVEDAPSALGFGGEHYAERFERRVWSEGWAFGHMIPERDFEHLTPELLDMCIEKTMPKVDFVVVDKRKKGTEEQRKVFFKVFEDKGIEIKKL